jgi:ribosomal protein L17
LIGNQQVLAPITGTNQAQSPSGVTMIKRTAMHATTRKTQTPKNSSPSRVNKTDSKKTFSLDVGNTKADETRSAARPIVDVGQVVRTTVRELDEQRKEIDKLIAKAKSGKLTSPAELIALQSQVYRYAQDMEIFSRVVDRTISAVKTTLNTQV